MAECGEISMMLGAFEDSELEPNEMQEVAFHLARCESCTGLLADYSTLGRNLRSIRVRAVARRFLQLGNRSRRSSAAAGADENRALPPAPVGLRRLRHRMGRRLRSGRDHDDNSDDAVRPAIRQSRDAADGTGKFGCAGSQSSGERGFQRAYDGGQRLSRRHLAARVGKPFGRSLERAAPGYYGHLVTGSALGRHDAAPR